MTSLRRTNVARPRYYLRSQAGAAAGDAAGEGASDDGKGNDESEERRGEEVQGAPPRARGRASLFWQALKAAFVSRLVTLACCVLFDYLLRDFDTSATLDWPTCQRDLREARQLHQWTSAVDLEGGGGDGNGGRWGASFGSAVRRAIVWDGVHFVRICQCGYEADHHIAFLPLWPLAMRGAAKAMAAPLEWLGRPQPSQALSCALGGLTLSNALFVASAASLFRLAQRLGLSDAVALRACLLYALNPATVFYSAIYTESLYTFLHFEALVHLLGDETTTSAPGTVLSTLLLAAATFTRSNGILSCAIVLAVRLRGCARGCIRGKVSGSGGRAALSFLVGGSQLKLFARQGLLAVAQCFFVLAPFYFYQVAFQLSWCQSYRSALESQQVAADGAAMEAKLDAMGAGWCTGSPFVPKVYSSVQSSYWNVGLFKFYELSQVPNFLLALPIWLCTAFLVHRFCATLFPNARSKRAWSAHLVRLLDDSGLFGQLVLCLHWALMCAISILVINVQVSTRFLSTCAPLYLFTAQLTTQTDTAAHLKWILRFFLTYAALGCILFPNFYPWV